MVFKQTSTILSYNVRVIIKAITKISSYCKWLLKNVEHISQYLLKAKHRFRSTYNIKIHKLIVLLRNRWIK